MCSQLIFGQGATPVSHPHQGYINYLLLDYILFYILLLLLIKKNKTVLSQMLTISKYFVHYAYIPKLKITDLYSLIFNPMSPFFKYIDAVKKGHWVIFSSRHNSNISSVCNLSLFKFVVYWSNLFNFFYQIMDMHFVCSLCFLLCVVLCLAIFAIFRFALCYVLRLICYKYIWFSLECYRHYVLYSTLRYLFCSCFYCVLCSHGSLKTAHSCLTLV